MQAIVHTSKELLTLNIRNNKKKKIHIKMFFKAKQLQKKIMDAKSIFLDSPQKVLKLTFKNCRNRFPFLLNLILRKQLINQLHHYHMVILIFDKQYSFKLHVHFFFFTNLIFKLSDYQGCNSSVDFHVFINIIFFHIFNKLIYYKF